MSAYLFIGVILVRLCDLQVYNVEYNILHIICGRLLNIETVLIGDWVGVNSVIVDITQHPCERCLVLVDREARIINFLNIGHDILLLLNIN